MFNVKSILQKSKPQAGIRDYGFTAISHEAAPLATLSLACCWIFCGLGAVPHVCGVRDGD